MKEPLAGAGSQFDSLSLPGEGMSISYPYQAELPIVTGRAASHFTFDIGGRVTPPAVRPPSCCKWLQRVADTSGIRSQLLVVRI